MKQFILTILFCAIMANAGAQDMTSVFTAMPDQKVPQLEHAWRKDLIDLFQAGKEARLKNTMNGYSALLKLTPNYLLLQSTERTTIEMKLLPLVNNTYVICMVTTVNGPVSDSQVEFFTTDWQPLAAADLFTPVTVESFLKTDIDKNDPAFLDATSRLDMELIKYNLDPDNQTLTATYTTPQYLGQEEREKVLPFLELSPKVMNWEKFHFK